MRPVSSITSIAIVACGKAPIELPISATIGSSGRNRIYFLSQSGRRAISDCTKSQ